MLFSFRFILFTPFLFSNILLACDWLFCCSVLFSDLLFSISVTRLLVSDWSANNCPYFAFSFACSDNMLITYSSS